MSRFFDIDNIGYVSCYEIRRHGHRNCFGMANIISISFHRVASSPERCTPGLQTQLERNPDQENHERAGAMKKLVVRMTDIG